jgi:Mor family transcriptional regulator
MIQKTILLLQTTFDNLLTLLVEMFVNALQTTVKKDVKKEEAEELKAKLEAVGGTVEIV